MKFFKIWGNIDAVDLSFCLFFLQGVSPSYRSADMYEMWHECVFLRIVQNAPPKFGKIQKTRSRRAKNIQISVTFTPQSSCFRSLRRNGLKVMNETTKISPRVLYLSENVSLTA